MRSRRAAFSLLAALALSLTLGLKAVVFDASAVPDVASYNRRLAASLQSQGWQVAIEDRFETFDVVAARRGECRLMVRIDETADRNESFRRFSAAVGPVRYRYAGRYHIAFPRFEYALRRRVNRALARLHLVREARLPLAIAASPECDMAGIDLGDQAVPYRFD